MSSFIPVEYVVYNTDSEGFIMDADGNTVRYGALKGCKGNSEKVASIMLGVNAFCAGFNEGVAEVKKAQYIVLQVVDGRVIYPSYVVSDDSDEQCEDNESNYRELTEYEDFTCGLW